MGCSGSDGAYSTTGIPDGEFDVKASAFGYPVQTLPVTIVAGGDQTLDFQLSVPAALGPVENVSASLVAGGVLVDWDAPLDDGGLPVVDYRVQFSPNGGVSWQFGSSCEAAGDGGDGVGVGGWGLFVPGAGAEC